MEVLDFAQKRVKYLLKQLDDNSFAIEASEMSREDLEDEYVANTRVMCQAIQTLFRDRNLWIDD